MQHIVLCHDFSPRLALQATFTPGRYKPGTKAKKVARRTNVRPCDKNSSAARGAREIRDSLRQPRTRRGCRKLSRWLRRAPVREEMCSQGRAEVRTQRHAGTAWLDVLTARARSGRIEAGGDQYIESDLTNAKVSRARTCEHTSRARPPTAACVARMVRLASNLGCRGAAGGGRGAAWCGCAVGTAGCLMCACSRMRRHAVAVGWACERAWRHPAPAVAAPDRCLRRHLCETLCGACYERHFISLK